jgi:hypothetical protein
MFGTSEKQRDFVSVALSPCIFRFARGKKPYVGGPIPAVKWRLIVIPPSHRKTSNNERRDPIPRSFLSPT